MTTETKARFTPGPWTVVDVDELRAFDPELVDTDALVVLSVTLPKTDTVNGEADVVCDIWHLAEDGSRRSEEEANARLIAAAPDLLAACKAALPWVAIINSLRDPEVTHPQAIQNAKDDLAMMLAAIAKAEGR